MEFPVDLLTHTIVSTETTGYCNLLYAVQNHTGTRAGRRIGLNCMP